MNFDASLRDITVAQRTSIRELRPYLSRPLVLIEQTLGDVRGRIAAIDNGENDVLVLEIGHGHGFALLELGLHFDRSVRFHGISEDRVHGSIGAAIWNFLDIKGWQVSELPRLNIPMLLFGDVGLGLPYDDCTFDFIYSHMCFFLVSDKALLVEEIYRVLKPGGSARIDIRKLTQPALPADWNSLCDVWEKGTRVPLGEYLTRFQQFALVRENGHSYLHIVKSGALDLNLCLVNATNLHVINPAWKGGYKTLYVPRTKR